ncbi:MAG: serine hydrolase domain-containing protein [bacterium]
MNALRLDELLNGAVTSQIFPGAVLEITKDGETIYRRAVGRQIYGPASPAITEDTMFDLASVTKAILATGFLKLIDAGRVSFEDPLTKYFPALVGSAIADRTIWNLLTHTSAVEAPMSQITGRGNSLEEILRAVELKGPVGSEVVFGNINSFLLGKIIEQVSGQRLDDYLRQEIFTPLGMVKTMFNPPGELKNSIPPTEIIDGTTIQGVVHDESSRALGGVAGQAGLFSCADDLTKFLQMWVNGGELNGTRILSRELAERATTNQVGNNLNLQAGLGWHFNNPDYLGSHSPVDTFFHPGFVGNIIAGNRGEKLTVVFLSNMSYPQRPDTQKRREFYRQLFDTLFKSI